MTDPQPDRTWQRVLDGLSVVIDLVDFADVLAATGELLGSLFTALH